MATTQTPPTCTDCGVELTPERAAIVRSCVTCAQAAAKVLAKMRRGW